MRITSAAWLTSPNGGIHILKAFDQGPSGKRRLRTGDGFRPYYKKYLAAVGDIDGDNQQDEDEPKFIRHRIEYGHVETIGQENKIEIRCVGVRGDTAGTAPLGQPRSSLTFCTNSRQSIMELRLNVQGSGTSYPPSMNF